MDQLIDRRKPIKTKNVKKIRRTIRNAINIGLSANQDSFAAVSVSEQLSQTEQLTIDVNSIDRFSRSLDHLLPSFGPVENFENANQFLLKLFHRTLEVLMQIVSAVSMAQGIPHLSVDCLSNGKEERSQFYKAVVQPCVAHQSSGTMIDESGIFSLGSVKIYALTDTEFIALCNYLPNAPVSNLVKQFLRCRLNGKIFQSEIFL